MSMLEITSLFVPKMGEGASGLTIVTRCDCDYPDVPWVGGRMMVGGEERRAREGNTIIVCFMQTFFFFCLSC